MKNTVIMIVFLFLFTKRTCNQITLFFDVTVTDYRFFASRSRNAVTCTPFLSEPSLIVTRIVHCRNAFKYPGMTFLSRLPARVLSGEQNNSGAETRQALFFRSYVRHHPPDWNARSCNVRVLYDRLSRLIVTSI